MINIAGPTVKLPGIRVFGRLDCYNLNGVTYNGRQYITTGTWLLDLELFRAHEESSDLGDFFENMFKFHNDWYWTPIYTRPMILKNSGQMLDEVFKKETKRVEITALSYHPSPGKAYRICMIEGESPTPVWIDNEFIEIFDICELSLHATGGPLKPIVLRGYDIKGNLCDYGIVMPVDFVHSGTDPVAQVQMAQQVFEILNRYPHITIDPQHFNIAGYKGESEGSDANGN